MALIKKEVEIAKEIDDCLALVVELIRDIKAKKGAVEIGTENLPNLINAMSGLDGVAEEMKNSKAVGQTVALRVGELVSVFSA